MTTKRRRKILYNKNLVRDTLTGQGIGNHECIKCENAIEYVKKMGFIVVKPRIIGNTIFGGEEV